MKKNFDAVLTNFEGQPLKDGDKEIKIGLIVENALISDIPDDYSKADRWRLAKRIHAGGDVEVVPEEIVVMKRLIDRAYGPVIVGPATDLLDA